MEKFKKFLPIGLMIIFIIALVSLVTSGIVSYAAETGLLDGGSDQEQTEATEDTESTQEGAPDFSPVAFGLPEYTHTDKVLTVKTHYIKAQDATWSLTDEEGNELDMASILEGTLDANGGHIRFTQDGTYTLTASATSTDGRDIEPYSQTIKVYPVPHITWTLPRDTHTDEPVTLTIVEENGTVSPDEPGTEPGGEENPSDDPTQGDAPGSEDEPSSGDSGEDEGEQASGNESIVSSVLSFIGNLNVTADESAQDGESSGGSENGNGSEGDNQGDQTGDAPTGDETGDGSDTGGDEGTSGQDTPAGAVEIGGLNYTFVVEDTYKELEWTSVITGDVTSQDGNQLQFTKPGVFEIVAKATDETGRNFVVRTGERVTVHPVLDLAFTLPTEAKTGQDVTIAPTGNCVELPVVWTLTRDEAPATFADCMTGTINSSGGTIQYTKPGRYTLTGTITDVTGRTYSHTENMTVHPDVEYVPAIDNKLTGIRKHLGEDFNIALVQEKGLEWVHVSWELKNQAGDTIPWTGVVNGNENLGLRGGGIVEFVGDEGDYTFVATIEDDYGWSMKASVTATAWNEAPNPPTVTKNEIDWTDLQDAFKSTAKVKVKLSSEATDAWPEDTIAKIEYDNPGVVGDGIYLPQGDITIKVRATDNWGKVGEWTDIPISVHATPPEIVLSSDSLDPNGLTSNGNVNVKGATKSSTPAKVSCIDYFHQNDNRTVFDKNALTGGYDAPAGDGEVALGYTASGHSPYAQGRHLVVSQIIDVFGNVNYASLYFVVGNSMADGSGVVKSSPVVLEESGVYTDDDIDKEYPLAYIDSFTFHVNQLPGHGGNDWIEVTAMREDGTWDTIVSRSQTPCSNGPCDASATVGTTGNGSYSSGGHTGTFDFPGNTYVQMKFSYYNSHPGCYMNATQSIVFTTHYSFKTDERTMNLLKKMFEEG